MGFSADIIPGTISAPGFNLEGSVDIFHSVDWSVAIKIVNSSEKDFAIENISSLWEGREFLCKSDDFLTRIYKLKYESDAVVISKLSSADNMEIIITPFLLKAQTETVIKVNFVLDIYKKKFPMGLDKFFFKKEEIKEPETYHALYQKNYIKIKLNGKWRNIALKAKEFMVAGDILKIPSRNN